MVDLPANIIEDIIAAAMRADVVAAMVRFYDKADQRIASYKPACWNKGECCRFGAFGHRLYVTTMEAAYYLKFIHQPPSATDDACPYSLGGFCEIRPWRPLGCRIFHCDPRAGHWQGPLTEQLLAELRSLHNTLNVPYAYADWMEVIKALPPSCPAT